MAARRRIFEQLALFAALGRGLIPARDDVMAPCPLTSPDEPTSSKPTVASTATHS